MQDFLITRLVTDKQQTQTVILHDLKCLIRDIGLGVARPGHTELAELSGKSLNVPFIVGQSVVVEEEFFDFREVVARPFNLADDVLNRAEAIAVS